MMKLLIASSLVMLGFAGAASATPIVVGDCSKFGGACVSVCAEGAADCSDPNALACVGASYQVPQCVETSIQTSAAMRCAADICDYVNLVCYKALKVECVA